MRIITGRARGCRLASLPGEETRPTAERVKEALFSILQFELEGRVVLDLFAGTGQLGLEALSRGAAHVVLVDSQAAAVDCLRRNSAAVCRAAQVPDEAAQVVHSDALAYLSRAHASFDVALLDPPYAANLLTPALQAVALHMQPGGVIVCETDRAAALPPRTGDFSLQRTYRYGRVWLGVYRPDSREEASP